MSAEARRTPSVGRLHGFDDLKAELSSVKRIVPRRLYTCEMVNVGFDLPTKSRRLAGVANPQPNRRASKIVDRYGLFVGMGLGGQLALRAIGSAACTGRKAHPEERVVSTPTANPLVSRQRASGPCRPCLWLRQLGKRLRHAPRFALMR
jgi:hypothetical protein